MVPEMAVSSTSSLRDMGRYWEIWGDGGVLDLEPGAITQTSNHLPISPHISRLRRPTSAKNDIYVHISPYLPTSPHISPYLPISPHISPYLAPAEADVGEGRHLLLELRADTSGLAQLRRKRARQSGAVEIEELARSEEKLAGSDPSKRRPTPLTETPHQAN